MDLLLILEEVVPAMLPDVAVIVIFPAATPVAKPALDMVALLVSDELQVTEPDKFWVVLSEYVPVAVNCCVAPVAILGAEGVTASETKAAVWAVIVNVVVAEILPNFAVIVVVPAATAVAKPVFNIFALLVSEEDQLTVAVTSCVELSEYFPVAVNC